MRIDTSPLLTRIEPIAFSFTWDAPDVDLGNGIDLKLPVRLEGSCSMNADIFLVEGVLSWDYDTVCDRCLKPVEKTVKIEFSEEFVHTEDPEFPDRYLFYGQTIDLTDMVTDLMILNQPLQNVCKPDCLGLCPVCGKDRNVTMCDCTQDTERENPFARLRTLLEQQEEETK